LAIPKFNARRPLKTGAQWWQTNCKPITDGETPNRRTPHLEVHDNSGEATEIVDARGVTGAKGLGWIDPSITHLVLPFTRFHVKHEMGAIGKPEDLLATMWLPATHVGAPCRGLANQIDLKAALTRNYDGASELNQDTSIHPFATSCGGRRAEVG